MFHTQQHFDQKHETVDDHQAQMTTLFLIRHGETEWNLKGIHQGHLDSPLTHKGENQARLLGMRLAREGMQFDTIYTSDLGRAMQSATNICKETGQEPLITREPRLRERALGLLEGLTYAEIEEKFPDDYASHISGDADYRPEGGESWRDIQERTVCALNDLASSNIGAKILCVTHGGMITMAVKSCLGIDIEAKRRFNVQNTALNILEWRHPDDWQLRTLGDTSHLQGDSTLDEML